VHRFELINHCVFQFPEGAPRKKKMSERQPLLLQSDASDYEGSRGSSARPVRSSPPDNTLVNVHSEDSLAGESGFKTNTPKILDIYYSTYIN